MLNSLKNIFIYKPKEDTPFELLEPNDEGNMDAFPNQVTKTKDKNSPVPLHPDNDFLSTDLNTNLERINKEFDITNNNDIKIRKFKIARKIDAFILYIDGMVDKMFVSDFVIRQLMNVDSFQDYFNNSSSLNLYDYIYDNIITANEVTKANDFPSSIINVLSGNSVLFINGSNQALVIDSKGFEKRSIDKPTAETVILGSQEAFTENMRTNVSLIRKIIMNQNLKTEIMKVSKTNQAFCSIMYLDGLTNMDIVNEVKKRISSIDTDFINGGGMLGQYIEDSKYSIFPQVLNTERPDRTANYILDGRVAIIVDGTPFIDIVPATFFDFIHAQEDASLRWHYGSFLRIIRILGILITVLAPALYVAVSLFHHEAIPTELLAAMASSKEEVPFPTLIEILMLEISFELIREGGIRVPGVIGQTLGIVGALILGQAAVTAKLVSPILIIIVAVTGIGSFSIPNYSVSLGLRMLRFFFVFLASILGFLGITEGIVIISSLACSLKSFGVPYLSTVSPTTKDSIDLIIKKPIHKQKQRPDFLNTLNRKRQTTSSSEPTKKDKEGENK